MLPDCPDEQCPGKVRRPKDPEKGVYCDTCRRFAGYWVELVKAMQEREEQEAQPPVSEGMEVKPRARSEAARIVSAGPDNVP